MPRPTKLASMPIAKIFELRDEIAEHLAQRRKALEQEIRQLDSVAQSGKSVTGKRSPMAGIKVKPKYRGPKGETWAGRGVHPTWLAALLKEGHKIDEFRIGAKPDLAAARKRTAAKRAAPKKVTKRKTTKKG